MSKKLGDPITIGRGYGCLGGVYAALRNRSLSLVHHEQHLAIAKKHHEKKNGVLSEAFESYGDSLMVLEDYDKAVECFLNGLKVLQRGDLKTQASMNYKLGNAYKALKKYQYSLYYYEDGCDLARDSGLRDIQEACEFNIASILQFSTQIGELEQAQKLFRNLISVFEKGVCEFEEAGLLCPPEYRGRLSLCYDGLQTILCHLGNKDECLKYAESGRRHSLSVGFNY